MKQIRDAINQFKEDNNEEFNTKDLIIYLIKRIDMLPCAEHRMDIAANAKDLEMIRDRQVAVIEKRTRTMMWMIPLFVACISLFIKYV